LSMNSTDRKKDHDIHDKSSAGRGTSSEREKNIKLGEALSMSTKRGWCHQKWIRITQEPKRGENTSQRGGVDHH